MVDHDYDFSHRKGMNLASQGTYYQSRKLPF